MIESGDVAEMGPAAFTIYCIIKSHVNFESGRTFPSLDLIMEETGIGSKVTVVKHLKTLQNMGYLEKKNIVGKSNDYRLIEKVKFQGKNVDGDKVPMEASWDYVPVGVKQAVQDIRNVIVSGVLPSKSAVHIQNLSINVQVIPNATTANQFNLMDIKDKELRNLIKRAMDRVQSPDDDDQL